MGPPNKTFLAAWGPSNTQVGAKKLYKKSWVKHMKVSWTTKFSRGTGTTETATLSLNATVRLDYYTATCPRDRGTKCGALLLDGGMAIMNEMSGTTKPVGNQALGAGGAGSVIVPSFGPGTVSTSVSATVVPGFHDPVVDVGSAEAGALGTTVTLPIRSTTDGRKLLGSPHPPLDLSITFTYRPSGSSQSYSATTAGTLPAST